MTTITTAKPRALVTIRLAGPDDVAVIHFLLADLARTIGESGWFRASEADLMQGGFGERPAFRAYFAEKAGRPVGLALFFYAFSTWRGRNGVYVQDLHVVASERRSGLGRKLLAAVAAHGRRDGCSHVRLSVAVGNGKARRFYRRLGFLERDDEIICQISDTEFDRLAEEHKP